MFFVFGAFYVFGLKVTKSAQIFFSQKVCKIGLESAEVAKTCIRQVRKTTKECEERI
jgi:hypothetical protein